MPDLISRAVHFGNRNAVCSDGSEFTYADIYKASAIVAEVLLNGRSDLVEQRVPFLVAPGFDYVRTQWGIWRAGGMAAPLCESHPLPALRYVVEDVGAECLVAGPGYEERLAPLAAELGIPLIRLADLTGEEAGRELPVLSPDRRAMILYTSGTTSRPKGVVTTHAHIEAQIRTLIEAWEWTPADRILCVLPLHHVHGIVNVVGCALWAGATVEFLPRFDPEAVFGVFRQGAVNVFMAVPTIYHKLITYWEQLPAGEQQAVARMLSRFRLMVSGSAALPVSVLEKWRAISGHTLLERYGMTEIGMALSNPYRGERRPGCVGLPLPGVGLRLVDEQNQAVPAGQPGEIQVRGATVFREYWNRPEATRDAFTDDGWFRTGDIAVFDLGSYRILGRDSVDIIKSGGYKISALEIEEVLRRHPAIRDCAVVGIPDEEWGEIVAAALVAHNREVDPAALDPWLREELPAYKIPRRYRYLAELPRNALGKVTKNELKKQF